jgi:hypothetical protein
MASEDHVLHVVVVDYPAHTSAAVVPALDQLALTVADANMLTNKNINDILVLYKKEQ